MNALEEFAVYWERVRAHLDNNSAWHSEEWVVMKVWNIQKCEERGYEQNSIGKPTRLSI